MMGENMSLFDFADNEPQDPETVQYEFNPDYGEQSDLFDFEE